MRYLVIPLLGLLLATPGSAWAEGGVDYTAVRLRGTAFSPLGGEALRISFRIRITLSDDISGGGLFDCRPRAGWPPSCPGRSGNAAMTFGYRDVIGSVSTAAMHVSFEDGSSCDFSGVMPLPVASNGSSILRVSSPIVSFSGSYACRDAQGTPTKSGDFFTSGGPPLPVPRCKGTPTPLCRPT